MRHLKTFESNSQEEINSKIDWKLFRYLQELVINLADSGVPITISISLAKGQWADQIYAYHQNRTHSNHPDGEGWVRYRSDYKTIKYTVDIYEDPVTEETQRVIDKILDDVPDKFNVKSKLSDVKGYTCIYMYKNRD